MGNTKIANIIYPEKFQTEFVFVYHEFEGELKDIIEKSGYKQEFIRKYRISLKMLDNLRLNCIFHKSRFEKLKNHTDLYSLKLHGNKNIRILFTFLDNGSKTIAVLLYPFQEKDDNNNGITSYNNAIEIAKARLIKLVSPDRF